MTTATQQVWQTQCFGSGTHIVHDCGRGPWLDVLFINPDDLDDNRARFQMCQDIAAWLNGGPRPVWRDDMERVSETEIRGSDGSIIQAAGPMYDANPPNLNWRRCEDEESKNERARLIDRLK